ncbi:hypothetical protein [Methylocystis sp.]|uniref:hypothetical protein n=1 Tax=Methylocystis sp. TaxID=1911079 RepID=UPI003DA23B29
MGILTGTPLEIDEALIGQALRELPRPEEVRDVTYEAGEDSEGAPVIWIWVITDDDVNPSSDHIRRLTDYSTSIRDWLLDNGVKHWPHVRIHRYIPRVFKRA